MGAGEVDDGGHVGDQRPRCARVRRALAALAAVGALSSCSAVLGDEAQTFPRPDAVDDGTVCNEWMSLEPDVRDAYAMHRLAEARANDGLDPAVDPPSEEQGRVLGKAMERQCRQDTMGVAAIWRVAHDQYTRRYDGGVLLD